MSGVQLLTSGSKRCSVESTSVGLYPHQRAALQRAIDFETSDFSYGDARIRTKHGIFGDSPGNGKTYICLALIVSGTEPRKFRKVECMGDGEVQLYSRRLEESCLPGTLLIVPHNIFDQWKLSIDEFGIDVGSVSFVATPGDLSALRALSFDVFSSKMIFLISAQMYGMFNWWVHSLAVKFRRVIVDEADSIRFPKKSKESLDLPRERVPASFYWYVSASYPAFTDQYYHRGWIHSIFNPVKSRSSDPLKHIPTCEPLVIASSSEFVSESIQLPPVNTYRIRCSTPAAIAVLHGLVNDEVIVRLHANDMPGALALLGHGHVSDSTDNIIALALADLERNVENAQVSLDHANVYQYSSAAAGEEAIASATSRLASCKERLAEAKSRILTESMCTVCYSDLESKTVTPCCKQLFCFACLGSAVDATNGSCPFCRVPIDMSTVFTVVDNPADLPGPAEDDHVDDEPVDDPDPREVSYPDKSSGLKAVVDFICAGNSAAKIIVFDECSRGSALIGDDISIERIVLKGTIASIRVKLARFRAATTPVAIFARAKQFGAGMNLECTTDMILLHRFSDSLLERQVIGRAQRPGRDGSLNLWHLRHDSE